MSTLLTVTDFKVTLSQKYAIIRRGSSVVERKPEELSVVGSIPTPGTMLRLSTPSGLAGYAWLRHPFQSQPENTLILLDNANSEPPSRTMK